MASLTRRVSFSRRARRTSGVRSGAGRIGDTSADADDDDGDEGNDTDDEVEAEVEREEEEEFVRDLDDLCGRCSGGGRCGFCCSYASNARRNLRAMASP